MRDGDVLVAINGVEVSHPEDVAALLAGQVRRIEMVVQRGVQRTILRFRV